MSAKPEHPESPGNPRTRAIYWTVGEHQTGSLLDGDLTFMVVERAVGD